MVDAERYIEIDRLALKYKQTSHVEYWLRLREMCRRLLHKQAKELIIVTGDRENAEAEADVALLKALTAWDPSRERAFAPFAKRVVRNHMKDVLRSYSRHNIPPAEVIAGVDESIEAVVSSPSSEAAFRQVENDALNPGRFAEWAIEDGALLNTVAYPFSDSVEQRPQFWPDGNHHVEYAVARRDLGYSLAAVGTHLMAGIVAGVPSRLLASQMQVERKVVISTTAALGKFLTLMGFNPS